jgi:hypothetical protein
VNSWRIRHRDATQSSDVVHQCPYCELRFSYMAAVKDHVVHDHPDHAANFEGVQVVELPHGT